MARWLSGWLLTAALLLVACNARDAGDATEETPVDPQMLLVDAAAKMRAADTFRMEVIHAGAPYFINLRLGENQVRVRFLRSQMQYVAEEEMDGRMSVMSAIGRIDLEAYARGDDQWYRLESSTFWVHEQFASDFNPRALIAEDAGFQVTVNSLNQLQYIGRGRLEDGTRMHHLIGTADGSSATALLVGLIKIEGDAEVDVFIEAETGYPVRLVICQPGTITEDDPEPMTFTVDFYDYNDEPDLIKPNDT